MPAGGPIPVYGPRRLVDQAEADRLWFATMRLGADAKARWRGPRPTEPLDPATAAMLADLEHATQEMLAELLASSLSS